MEEKTMAKETPNRPGFQHYHIEGRIKRLYLNSKECIVEIVPIKLADNQAEFDEFKNLDFNKNIRPYFHLELEHPNYNSLYSLILSGALNDLPVSFRLDDFQKGTPASNKIIYVRIDWNRE